MVRASNGLLALCLLVSGVTHADEREGPRLPDFRLEDPAGVAHTRESLASGGLVLVVTAPTRSNERAQRGWDDCLGRERPPDARGRLAFLEDLQQSWFPQAVLIVMRREYVAGAEPVLLLDREGGLRRALGVDAGVTVVLAFDAHGALRLTEAGPPSAEAARRLWTAVAP